MSGRSRYSPEVRERAARRGGGGSSAGATDTGGMTTHRPPSPVTPAPGGAGALPARRLLLAIGIAALGALPAELHGQRPPPPAGRSAQPPMAAPPPARQAATLPTDAVLDEIRSLRVRVAVAGGGAAPGGVVGPALERVITAELERAGVLRDLPLHREGECCELLLDVRLAHGAVGVPDWGGVAAYSARLELSQRERLGRLEGRLVLWSGRSASDVVAPSDLTDQLRFAARELAAEFVDRYRQRYPMR